MPATAPRKVRRSTLDQEFERAMTRIIGDRAVGCPHCRYNLSGVPGPLCPECGKDVSDYLRIADTAPWRLPQQKLMTTLKIIARRVFIAVAILSIIVVILLAFATQ